MNKTRRILIWCIAVLLLTAVTWAAFKADSHLPLTSSKDSSAVKLSHASTRPSATAPSTALPAEYAILQTRNAFGHGPHAPGGPDVGFVFKGVAQTDSRFTAFIEDTSSKNVVRAAVGDSIARGRIKNIDLNSVIYEVGSDARRIEVGQNLNGEVVQPLPTSMPASPPPPVPEAAPPPPDQNGPPQMPQPPQTKLPKR